MVYKLNKALYGLKQGSKTWNHKLDKRLKQIGLVQSKVDQCVYHHIKGNKHFILTVFVDDLIIFTNWKEISNFVKQELFSTFSMKDLGNVKNVLA